MACEDETLSLLNFLIGIRICDLNSFHMRRLLWMSLRIEKCGIVDLDHTEETTESSLSGWTQSSLMVGGVSQTRRPRSGEFF